MPSRTVCRLRARTICGSPFLQRSRNGRFPLSHFFSVINIWHILKVLIESCLLSTLALFSFIFHSFLLSTDVQYTRRHAHILDCNHTFKCIRKRTFKYIIEQFMPCSVSRIYQDMRCMDFCTVCHNNRV